MSEEKSVLRRLLSSRKFLMAVAAVVVSAGVLLSGWSEATAAEASSKIVDVILIVSVVFMGSTAAEDVASKINGSGEKKGKKGS